MKKTLLFILAIGFNVSLSAQKNKQVVVSVNTPGASIQSDMWGIFFEDINFAADGGLYAELVKNRSFEFDAPLMGWKETSLNSGKGRYLVYNSESGNNPQYINIVSDVPEGKYGLLNEGFRGMGVKSGNKYNFSILARNNEKSPASIYIELRSAEGKVIGQTQITGIEGEWKKYTASFECTATDLKANLAILIQGKANIDLDMISLFPNDTWKNRPNGMRSDLVQLLADMKPGFIRFPGGCIVEGKVLENRYQWKTTVSGLTDRKTIINRWNTEFSHRSTPDYFQSFGLGFFEYFQLAEDIGAAPLPIINCGMACQYNSSELVPLKLIDPYVQDALDLIEFANAPVNSKWGALRAEMGHPAPFNLKMIGVGNEQWGPQYFERYQIFVKAIKEKYPDIKIISGAGPSPDNDMFHFAWGELRKLNAELVDEHYYRNPEWFLKNANRYDNYDRKGPKVFAGEYASHVKGTANNWEAALSEAAFMTGLERNADVVVLASYAPLFAHVDAWQWKPDLIWFNNLISYGSPSYYVQKMFATNNGEFVIPALSENKPLAGQDSLYISASISKTTSSIILKIANVSSKATSLDFSLEGAKAIQKNATLQLMEAVDLTKENSLESPKNLAPSEKTIAIAGKKFTFDALPRSFSVLRIQYK